MTYKTCAAATAILLAAASGLFAQETPKPPGEDVMSKISDALMQPFQSLGSQGSMQGVWSAPAPAVARPATTPDLPAGSDDWIFSGMNELFGPSKSSDSGNILQLAPLNGGGQSAVERYYNNLGQSRSTAPSQAMQLMKSVTQGQDGKAPTSSSFDNFFAASQWNAGATAPSVADQAVMQKRHDDFRRMLDPLAPAAPVSQDPMAAIRSSIRQPVTPLYSTATIPAPAQLRPSSLTPMLGVADPTASALRNQALIDPTVRALGTPARSVLPDPPKPARTTLDPTPQPPRRRF